jgi:uncharacterized coiled-coil protein SlyX
MKTDDLVNRIEMLEEQVTLHEQLISTLSLLTIETLAMFDDEEKVNTVLDRFNKSLDKLVDDDRVDTSSVSRDIKTAVTQYWENTDPKKRTSH